MQHVRLTTPKQVIEAIPMLLGYSPMGSLLALPLQGAHGGVILRFDLPRRRVPRPTLAGYASAVVGHLAHLRGIESVILILCPQLDFGPGPRPPHAELYGELTLAGARAGIDVVLGLCRARDAWGVYGCEDADCCDVGPRELDPKTDWHELSGDPADAAAPSLESERRRSDFRRAFAEHREHCTPGGDLGSVLSSLENGAEAEPSTQFGGQAQLARLLCVLRDRSACEQLLLALCFGEASPTRTLGRLWGSVLSSDSGTDAFSVSEELLTSFRPGAVQCACDLLRLIAGLVDLGGEPGLCAALAWLDWAAGRSSAAVALARRALATAPDDPIASSVVWLVERNVFPPWLATVAGWDPQETESGRTRG